MRIKPDNLVAMGLVLSVVAELFLRCMCGHLGIEVLPITFAGALLVWIAIFQRKAPRLFLRFSYWFCAVATSLICFLNLHNVLWSGHNPIFP